MRALIVSAGKSAVTAKHVSNADLHIVINSAVEMPAVWTPDWWFAADKGTLQRCKPATQCVGLVTMRENIDRVISGRYESYSGHLIKTWEAINFRGLNVDWSLNAALFFAADEGATSVEVHGADWTGQEDVAGFIGKRRHEVRWEREKKEYRKAVSLLEAEGVTVTRKQEENTNGRRI